MSLAASADQLFQPLASGTAVLLAVSGGPDSMALCLLAATWARGPARPPVFVATVDHGLRPESRAEAELVARVAAAHGLPYRILDWRGPKPKTRIQERARTMRYALLAEEARRVGATLIATGHHADDQAETILLRLARGSGLHGLAGMPLKTELEPNLWLVRPLIDQRKAALVALCTAENCPFVEDPSNDNEAFARTRLRRAMPALVALGLDTSRLVRLGARLARAEAALEAETDRVARLRLSAASPSRMVVELGGDVLPAEIRLRLLARAIATLAPDKRIRLERLETLSARLAESLARGAPLRATLGGTVLTLDETGVLCVEPEGPRQRGGARPD